MSCSGCVQAQGGKGQCPVLDASSPVARARETLRSFAIGINHAGNGVFLPANTRSPNPGGAAVHSRVHTNAYYNYVNDRLSRAASRGEALQILEDIRGRLIRGQL